jgi:hypothetical protein
MNLITLLVAKLARPFEFHVHSGNRYQPASVRLPFRLVWPNELSVQHPLSFVGIGRTHHCDPTLGAIPLRQLSPGQCPGVFLLMTTENDNELVD